MKQSLRSTIASLKEKNAELEAKVKDLERQLAQK